ncbi:hypothetical protein [Flavobacterium sp. 3HN19-14]|uniref:hypothetical protein n=1 Tax=Flavobacterium sp. 3HN19-14 TaxID=3448133 RepID=UPI003EE1D533
MKKICAKMLLILISLMFASCAEKPESLSVIFDFPNNLKEVSSAEISEKSGLIWVCEDSGNQPEIYGLNTKGEIINTVHINGVENNDWEDLTSDNDGNIYIGDFGNNANERQNLAIYKINAADLVKPETQIAEKIEFYYPEQQDFPPKKSQRIFDCEAFFFTMTIFIFSPKTAVPNLTERHNYIKSPTKPDVMQRN